MKPPKLPVADAFNELESDRLKGTHHCFQTLVLCFLVAFFASTLEFVALIYLMPNKNQFACKLEGLKSDWNHVGGQETPRFTNLTPGEHALYAKASAMDRLRLSDGKRAKITVTQAFLNTWWFKILLVSAIAMGVYLAMYLRRLRKRNLELETSVHDRTSQLAVS